MSKHAPVLRRITEQTKELFRPVSHIAATETRPAGMYHCVEDVWTGGLPAIVIFTEGQRLEAALQRAKAKRIGRPQPLPASLPSHVPIGRELYQAVLLRIVEGVHPDAYFCEVRVAKKSFGPVVTRLCAGIVDDKVVGIVAPWRVS